MRSIEEVLLRIKVSNPDIYGIDWDNDESDGKITSLFFISINDNAKLSAAVPLFTAIQEFDFTYFLNSFSNASTFAPPAPDAQKLLFKTDKIDFFSLLSILTSNNLMTFLLI